MKKYLLFFVLAFTLVLSNAFATGDDKKESDDILRKSKLKEPPNFTPTPSSYPLPFSEIGNAETNPAVSTGYYFVDSDDEAPDMWRPDPNFYDDTAYAPDGQTRMFRVTPGPRIYPASHWDDPLTKEIGLSFFRNPALPTPSGDFFNGATDSTDDAIAGPMKIGFPFVFNGLPFDSFYVSTNGIIALTNSRYKYNSDGSKSSDYNYFSMDWFARSNRLADASLDPTPDDYGYRFAVCGGDPLSQYLGIRQRGGHLNTLPNKSHVIAPFFGNLQLSQFWSTNSVVDDLGKCFFSQAYMDPEHPGKRATMIYFLNAQPVGPQATPFGTYNAPWDIREGDRYYIASSAQVTLREADSSITIVYGAFTGVAQVSGRPVTAELMFRWNTSIGVRGFARHTNYKRGGNDSLWAGEYEQYTNYISKYQTTTVTYPKSGLAIRFKQWKNTVRVVDIQYRVRKQDPNADLDFTEQVPTTQVNNYELLAGEERIGAIQPIAILQNLTNDIQGPKYGVNYQQQQLRFRARFRIINEATNKPIYNRLVPIDSTCLALPDSLTQDCSNDPYVKVRLATVSVDSKGNYTVSSTFPAFPGANKYNGIPPYQMVLINFPPFEPNEFVANHIGRLRAYIVADPTNPLTNQGLYDAWPFDDTTSVLLFVMRRLDNFSDDVTEWHMVNRSAMPSVLKWVNINAEVADGDLVSVYPLPPRGTYPAANMPSQQKMSPVIRMNRVTLAGEEPPAYPGGDELRSFPIDLRGRFGAVLSLSIARHTAKDMDESRGWSDAQELGVEPRTVVNSDPFTVWTYGYSVSSKPNEIWVQFAQPSPNNVQYITNITDKRWLNHPRRGGAKPVTDVPAFSLYGGVGSFRGWLETDHDSALSKPSFPYTNGLRADLYDDGIDWEYKKVILAIPDTFIRSSSEGAKNFRFRIKVMAYDDKKCISCIPDDVDDFFVDNVKILFRSEVPDIECSNVRITWPYTIAPASQAIKIPIRVRIANNTSVNSQTFLVKVKIFKQGDPTPIYCRFEQVPFMSPGATADVIMPNWDARQAGEGNYRLQAILRIPGGDLEPLNDTTYTDVTLKFGDVFAYDPATNPRNDVPDAAFTGVTGRGLNLFGFAEGGFGSINGPSGQYNEGVSGAGYVGGNGSGQIAVRFQLFQQDTIYGYQAFFDILSWSPDGIALAVYQDQGQPGQIVPGTKIYRQRVVDDIQGTQLSPPAYFNYRLPKPIVLPAGKYWASIAQLGETGMELGASKSRMGMRTTSVYIPPPTSMVGPVGGGGIHLMLNKNFRKLNQSGGLINDNFFAFENVYTSNTWYQFMPTVGNPAYAHLHHFGVTPLDQYATNTLTRGTWVPMLRPYLGKKATGSKIVYQECYDDIYPVELTNFDGQARKGGIDLFWETSSEIKNQGFYVEKRLNGDDYEWNSIGFVKGAGTSRTTKNYNYLDQDVKLNTSYQYRLRQVDIDGSQDCGSLSNVITLAYNETGDLSLEQNSPNPFTSSTTISFFLPSEKPVKLEVLDMYGNVVKTLVDGKLNGPQSFDWNGTTQTGSVAASGSYIYRLTAGDETRIGKMTLVR